MIEKGEWLLSKRVVHLEISAVLTGVFELSVLNNPGTNPAVPVQLLLVVLGICISSHFHLPLLEITGR